MNAYAETAASASFNIAYNSLERRFGERGTADSVRRLAAEQEENELLRRRHTASAHARNAATGIQDIRPARPRTAFI